MIENPKFWSGVKKKLQSDFLFICINKLILNKYVKTVVWSLKKKLDTKQKAKKNFLE